jgi:hypothetical protein
MKIDKHKVSVALQTGVAYFVAGYYLAEAIGILVTLKPEIFAPSSAPRRRPRPCPCARRVREQTEASAAVPETEATDGP